MVILSCVIVHTEVSYGHNFPVVVIYNYLLGSHLLIDIYLSVENFIFKMGIVNDV